MSMALYKAGGRTRQVVNLASETAGTAAYTITATTAEPSAATDGYKVLNNGQRFLHVVSDWTSPQDGTSTATLQLWAYHTFSGKWGRLQLFNASAADGTNKSITIVLLIFWFTWALTVTK